jgi:hypothetical protein
MGRSPLGAAKGAILPRGKRSRRLPFGIAAGIRIEIDFSVQTKMFLGMYEVELNKYLRRLVRPGCASFDVGAQFGYDALVLAKLSGARVASIECDAGVIPELRRNIDSNPTLRDQIELIDGFVAATTDHEKGTIALDDLAYGGALFVPDFIKMDIEGGELDALMGSRRILEERHPDLLVETHSAQLESECLDLIRSFGYQGTIVDTRRFLPDYRPTEHNRWFVASHTAPVARTAGA